MQFISDVDGAVRLSLELQDNFGASSAETVHLSVNNARWVAEAEVDVLALSSVTELRMRMRAATSPVARAPGMPWPRVGLQTLRPAAVLAPLATAASLLVPIIASYAEFTSNPMPAHAAPHITVSSKHDLEEGIRQAMVRNVPNATATAAMTCLSCI